VRAQAQLTAAAHAYGSRAPREAPDAPAEAALVLQASALTEAGVAGVWDAIEARLARARASGTFDARRHRQATAWMWDMIAGGLQAAFRADPGVKAALPKLVAEVAGGRVAPSVAARHLLERWARARSAAA
jgi:LAO/AO transport system kinase